MLGLVDVQWFHLDYHVPILHVNVRWMEDAAVRFERATALMPSSLVKPVEVVSPIEFELIMCRVVVVDFNPVVENVPGHVSWV